MEASPPIALERRLRALRGGLDPQALAVWLLGFLLVVYLALNGGGYDPLIRDQIGIAVWWGVLLGLAVGALPLNRLRYGSGLALALLGAYVAWVALSAGWSRSGEGTFADLGRVSTYLGVFALALLIRAPRGARRMVGALGAAIAVVGVIALLSRLHPAWFPHADETASFLPDVRNRLAYPLGYWNGVAALVAIGLPLVLYFACCARHIITQALAAAALPALALAVYFTFSRGGSAAAILALALFLALSHDRLPKAATTLIAATGAAILIAAAAQRAALNTGLSGPLAHRQGNELLAMTLVVCAGVGLIQAGLALALREGARPPWSRPSAKTSRSLMAGVLAVALVAAIALGVGGKVSSAWQEFKSVKEPPRGAARLASFSSNGRWPYWQATLRQEETAPLAGTGSGSFESWWAQHGSSGGFVQDAHSLYFETLGELGIVGLALIVCFLGWILVSGTRRWASASRDRRTQLGAALAGCAAFCLAAGFDWLWELAVIPIAFLLLASVLISAGERPRRSPLPIWARVIGVAVCGAAMVAIAIPLSAAASLQASQAQAREANLNGALAQARDAQGVEPFAAAPRLQEALVLEAERRLASAARVARAATENEPQDWRAWLIRSRIEAERGQAPASVASYRRARSLNPRSVLFQR